MLIKKNREKYSKLRQHMEKNDSKQTFTKSYDFL